MLHARSEQIVNNAFSEIGHEQDLGSSFGETEGKVGV